MPDIPITPNSLPVKSTGELNYGPELTPQPGFPDSTFNLQIPEHTEANVNPFGSLYDDLNKGIAKNASKKDYYGQAAAMPFNAESTMFDKFESTNHGFFSNFFSDYQDKGFVPWRDNDDTYNQDTSVIKELYRSTKWAAPLFGEGFISGLRSFPDLIEGMYSASWDPILKSDDRLAAKWARAGAMGGSTAGKVSSFLTNFEISAANMLGMLTETAIEDGIIALATGASFGGTAPLAVAEAANTASKFKTIYKGLKDINKVVDIFKDANDARRFYEITWAGTKAFAKRAVRTGVDFLNPIRQTTGYLKDLYKGEEYLKNASTLGKTMQGFGSFYRDLREVNFALSESKMEGGSAYLERRKLLYDEYINKNNKLPEGEEAANIEKNAREQSRWVTQTNLPTIYYSNRLGFGNFFKGFTPLAKMADEAGTKSLKKLVQFNTAKKVFEKASEFSVKKAYRYGVGTSINYFKANFFEGFQENLQDVIQGAAKDYYAKKFENPSYGSNLIMLGDISNNFSSQVLSGQGAETFFSGFAMGAVIGGGARIKSGIQNLTYRISNKEGYKEFQQKRTEQLDQYIDRLNDVYKNELKYLDPELANAARQGELSKYLAQAVSNKNAKQFYDIKDQAVYEHLSTMVNAGKADVFRDRLEEFKQLTPEEFEDALGFKVDDPTNFKGYIDQQIKKLDLIQRLHDEAGSKFVNPINLNAYKKDSPEWQNAVIQYKAFENAKDQAVFANYSFMSNAERMQSVLKDMTKIKTLAKSNYLDLTVLTSPNLLDTEIGMLSSEINSIKLGISLNVGAEGQSIIANEIIREDKVKEKKRLTEKESRLKTLLNWRQAMDSPQLEKNVVVATKKQLELQPTPGRPEEFGGDKIPLYPVDYPALDNSNYDNWRRAAKLAFEKHIEVEAGIAKDSVYRDGVDKAFNLLMDYHTLGKEQEGLTKAVNILSDPKNFLDLYDNHIAILRELYKNKVEHIKKSIELALADNDKNSLVNKLAGFGFYEDSEEPGTYYRTDETEVEKGSEDYLKIQQIITDHEAAIAPAPAPVVTPPVVTPTPAPVVPPAAPIITPTPVSDQAKKDDIEKQALYFSDKWYKEQFNDGANVSTYIDSSSGAKTIFYTLPNKGIIAFTEVEKNTNRFSITANAKDDKSNNIKDAFQRIQKYLPLEHELIENKSISVDGLRVWNNFIKNGKYVETNEVKEIPISAIDKSDIFKGLNYTTENDWSGSKFEDKQETKDEAIARVKKYLKDNNLNFKVRIDDNVIKVEVSVLKSNAKLSTLQPTAPVVTPTVVPVVPTALELAIAEINEVVDDEGLGKLNTKYVDKPSPKILKSFTDAERQLLIDALLKKYLQLHPPVDKPLLDETDPEFIEAYNAVQDKVKKLLANPKLTEQEIKDIFNNFGDVIFSLKDEFRAKYAQKHRLERDALIEAKKNNQKARDINALKIQVDNIFNNTELITEIENQVFMLFNGAISPEIKDQIVDHYIKQLEKKLNDRIAKLESALGSAENDEIIKNYIAKLSSYKSNIEKALARHIEESKKLKIKFEQDDINISNVGVDENYENDVHVGIKSRSSSLTKPPTFAQDEAINNLKEAGVITEDEAFASGDFMIDASDTINLGVARIYTIQINKAARDFIKTGDTAKLEKVLIDYETAARDGRSNDQIAEEIKRKIERIKTGDKTVVDILKRLNLPESSEITDEQFTLLSKLRQSITDVQTEAGLLDTLNTLQSKQQDLVNKGAVITDVEDLLDQDDIEVIGKYLTKEKGEKFDIKPFYRDLIQVIDSIHATKDVRESEKLIKELVKKYALSYRQAQAAALIRAFVGHVLETEGMLGGQIEIGEELSDEEILRILNGEKRTLTPSQIKQVEGYEKDLIEMNKNRMQSAPSYEEMLEEYNPKALTLPEGPQIKFSALREKDPGDIRTAEDLAKEYGVKDGRINTKVALQLIIDGEFSTDSEKELASKLLLLAEDTDFIVVNNKIGSAGGFYPDDNSYAINLNAIGYKEEAPSNPIETVILHELLHGKIEEALSNPDDAYTKSIMSLMASVKTDPRAKTFYAFQEKLSEDEKMREFVIEAFTNPAFQQLLATTPYAKSGKSAWQKFISILNDILKAIGLNIEGSVLNEVINQTTELLKYPFAKKLTERAAAATTKEDILALKEELKTEESNVSPNTSESVNSLLDSKLKSITASEVTAQAAGLTITKINGKTYHFKVTDKGLEIFRKSNYRLQNVRKAETIEKFINDKLAGLGIESLVSANNMKLIRDLIGDGKDDSSYASGKMNDEDKAATKSKIKSLLSKVLGLPKLSDEIQNKIESELIIKAPETPPGPPPPPPTQTSDDDKGDFSASTKKPKTKKGKDPSAYDASVVDPKITITPQNSSALRSTSMDVWLSNQQETPYFSNYYYKVRDIINALSIKDLSELTDINISLDKDSADFRWDGSINDPGWIKSEKGVIGYLSDTEGNPLVFNKRGEIVGKLDKKNPSDKKGLEGDDNQIVYFQLFKNKNSLAGQLLNDDEGFAKIIAARERVMAGKPQLAKLVMITQGTMNNKILVKNSQADRANTATNLEFYNQVTQPNVETSVNGAGLSVTVVGPDGGTNNFDMWTPNTRDVIWTNNGVQKSIFDHLITVMQTYNEMLLRNDPNADIVMKDLTTFVYNMWLTGEKYKLQIPAENLKNEKFQNIRIRSGKELVAKKVIDIVDGKVVLNAAMVEQARMHMNNMPINISKSWWSGKMPFKFPRIVNENGVNVVKFTQMNYKDFMFRQIGFNSNTTALQAQENIKRYNSSILFTEPMDLVEPVSPIITTEEELKENVTIIKTKNDEIIKNSTEDTPDETNAEQDNAIKKKRRFNAPSYDEIIEKIC